MSEPIHRLIRELRAESCPPQVLAKVRESIAQERRPARPSWLALRRLALGAGLAVVLLLTVSRWLPLSKPNPVSNAAPVPTLSAVQVVDQTHLSLACIGTTVVEAGNRTETIIINRVKPRLLDCLDKAVQALPNLESL